MLPASEDAMSKQCLAQVTDNAGTDAEDSDSDGSRRQMNTTMETRNVFLTNTMMTAVVLIVTMAITEHHWSGLHRQNISQQYLQFFTIASVCGSE